MRMRAKVDKGGSGGGGGDEAACVDQRARLARPLLGLVRGGGFSEAAPFPSERAAGAFFLEEVALEAAGPTSLGALASSSLLSAGKASAPQLPALSFWNDLVGGLSRLPR